MGLGLIGQEIARLGRGFGMTVLVYDPYVSHSDLDAYDAQPVDLLDLAARSDIVAVAAKVSRDPRTDLGFGAPHHAADCLLG